MVNAEAIELLRIYHTSSLVLLLEQKEDAIRFCSRRGLSEEWILDDELRVSVVKANSGGGSVRISANYGFADLTESNRIWHRSIFFQLSPNNYDAGDMPPPKIPGPELEVLPKKDFWDKADIIGRVVLAALTAIAAIVIPSP